ncbi:MAG: 50S ribosomal protein L3 [Candidatus Hodgkinia cicadicola]
MKIIMRKLASVTVSGKLCTVLEALACVVLDKTYNSITIGYNPKTILSSFGFVKVSKQFRFNSRLQLNNEFGSVLQPDWLPILKKAHANALTKGKGFAGVIKRHGFSGLRKSHGVSLAHRACGAIGARQDPGRVWKGQKMAGRMGGTRVTVKNLKLLRYDAFACKLLLFGGVPGATKSSVVISGGD